MRDSGSPSFRMGVLRGSASGAERDDEAVMAAILETALDPGLPEPREPAPPVSLAEERESRMVGRLREVVLSDSLGSADREELVEEVVRVVLGGEPAPARVAAERVASLQHALTVTLWRELDPDRWLIALERLGSVTAGAQAAVSERMLRSQARRLEQLANTDPLTGLRNLRFLREHLEEMLALHHRYGHRFGVLLVDVDRFKRINDTFGHAEGDRMLVRIASVIRESVRESDTGVRIGGDEFCVLAPADTLVPLRVLAERVASAVRRVRAPDGEPTSVSIGIVACPLHGHVADRLLELADRAMYEAKASRRHTAMALPREAEQ